MLQCSSLPIYSSSLFVCQARRSGVSLATQTRCRVCCQALHTAPFSNTGRPSKPYRQPNHLLHAAKLIWVGHSLGLVMDAQPQEFCKREPVGLAGDKDSMMEAIVDRKVRQYQVSEYEKGQRATNYPTWLSSSAHYTVNFAEVCPMPQYPSTPPPLPPPRPRSMFSKPLPDDDLARKCNISPIMQFSKRAGQDSLVMLVLGCNILVLLVHH